MKTRYKIPIIVVIVFIAIFALVPVTYAPLICDDQILSLDDCGNYLEEKYTKLPIVQHFMVLYPEASGLGSSFQWYQVQTVTAGAILEDKNYVSLDFQLNNSSVIYRCEKHTKEEYHLLVHLINPAIEDLDKNNCRDLVKTNLEKLSENMFLSRGVGFDLSDDNFTQDDLKLLQERENNLRKIIDNPDTPYEERESAVTEFNEMQLRLQNPFQTGVPYELAEILRVKMMLRPSIIDNLDLYDGEYPEHTGSWHISDKYQAIIIDIKSEYFTMENLENYDKFVREYLGNEVNILYKK